jgi:hypothetical protein
MKKKPLLTLVVLLVGMTLACGAPAPAQAADRPERPARKARPKPERIKKTRPPPAKKNAARRTKPDKAAPAEARATTAAWTQVGHAHGLEHREVLYEQDPDRQIARPP